MKDYTISNDNKDITQARNLGIPAWKFPILSTSSSISINSFAAAVSSVPETGKKIIYNMGKATPTHDVPEKARLALEKSAGKVGAHPYMDDIAGKPSVRKSVADYINFINANTSFKSEDVIVTNGAVEATGLLISLQQNKFPRSNVLVSAPYYNVYNKTMYPDGYNLVPVITTKESRFLITPQMLDAAFKWNPNVKTIVFDGGPTNPAGSIYTLEETKALAQKLEEIVTANPDVHILLDEVCKGLEYQGKKHYSLFECASPKLRQHISIAHSASKIGSMSYDRIGALLSENKKLIGELVNFKMGFNMASNEPAQLGYAALLDGFRENPNTLQHIAIDYQTKAEYVMSRLDKIGNLLYPNGEKKILPVRPEGMFIMWADFSGLIGKPVPQELKKILNKDYITSSCDIATIFKENSVIVCSGAMFNKPGSKDNSDFIRFSAPLDMQSLEKAMDIVDSVVRDILQQQSKIIAFPKNSKIEDIINNKAAQLLQSEQASGLTEVEKRLQKIGVTLADNVSSPLGLYLPLKISGKNITLSGVLCHKDVTGAIMQGKVIREGVNRDTLPKTSLPLVTKDEAKLAARNTAIEILSILKRDLKKDGKTLDDLKGIHKLDVLVNTGDHDFPDFAYVGNGASEVFLAAFGNDMDGKAARAAYGVANLPGNALVEMTSSFELNKELELEKNTAKTRGL